MPATDLALHYQELSQPRRGHRAEECEDAWAASLAAEGGRGRFAVADGAAESFQGGLWARLLAEAFVGGGDRHPDWVGWLPPLQARWAEEATLDARPGGGPNGHAPPALPWYLESRLHQQGAFATF